MQLVDQSVEFRHVGEVVPLFGDGSPDVRHAVEPPSDRIRGVVEIASAEQGVCEREFGPPGLRIGEDSPEQCVSGPAILSLFEEPQTDGHAVGISMFGAVGRLPVFVRPGGTGGRRILIRTGYRVGLGLAGIIDGSISYGIVNRLRQEQPADVTTAATQSAMVKADSVQAGRTM